MVQVTNPGKAVMEGAYFGAWTVGTVLDISSQAQKHFTFGRDTNLVRCYSDSDVYVLFDTAGTTANSTGNDQIYEAGRFEIPVPRKLYEGEVLGSERTIYMHVLQVTSVASKKLRVVES